MPSFFPPSHFHPIVLLHSPTQPPPHIDPLTLAAPLSQRQRLLLFCLGPRGRIEGGRTFFGLNLRPFLDFYSLRPPGCALTPSIKPFLCFLHCMRLSLDKILALANRILNTKQSSLFPTKKRAAQNTKFTTQCLPGHRRRLAKSSH